MKKNILIFIFLTLFIILCGEREKSTNSERNSINISELNNYEPERIGPKFSNSLPKKRIINFMYPNEIRIGESFDVSLKINRHFVNEKIIEEGYDITQEKIEVSTVMRSELKGKNIDIECIDKDSKIVTNKIPTEWLWIINPVKKDKGFLVLKIFAKIKTDENINYIPIYREKIKYDIKGNWWFSFKKFWKENWQYFTSVVIIPILIWYLSNRKKKKNIEK